MSYDLHFVQPADDDHFGANVFAMGKFAEAMWNLDMIYESEAPRDWPGSPHGTEIDDALHHATLDWIEYERRDGVPAPTVADHIMTSALDAAARRANMRIWHPDGGDTIPLHKIYGTNDGWIITPDELRAALTAYEQHPDRDTVYTTMNGLWGGGRWQAWIDYLTRAADHHGIEVR